MITNKKNTVQRLDVYPFLAQNTPNIYTYNGEMEVFDQVTPSTPIMLQPGQDGNKPSHSKTIDQRMAKMCKSTQAEQKGNITDRLIPANRAHCLTPPITGIERAMLSVSSQDTTESIINDIDPAIKKPMMNSDGCDRFIDICSCMCCARAVFYHLNKDADGSNQSDELLNCNGLNAECTKKVCVLSIMTCFFPCMLLYPFMKGTQALLNFL